MYALVLSSTVGDAEAHVEFAVFDVPEGFPDDRLFGQRNLIGKAVFGMSHTFGVGNGLTVLGEYHYSGFGVEHIADAIARFSDPAFEERVLRGDTQITGQHAIGLQASYPFSDACSAGVLFLVSPEDGSGLAAPSVRFDIAENTTLAASAFIPWGREPSGGAFESEYGGSPVSFFLHLSVYF